MNRIILIGNGFDKAHNLETGYDDFIGWYWDKWGERLLASSKNCEEDKLLSFKLLKKPNVERWNQVAEFYFADFTISAHTFIEKVRKDSSLCEIEYKSELFSTICRSLKEAKWVDIENVYYSLLSKGVVDPKVVNDDLDYIREKLIEYLTGIQNGITDGLIKTGILDKIKSPFDEKDISVAAMDQSPDMKMQFIRSNHSKTFIYPEKTLLLTFNYTGTADLYQRHVDYCTVNHIHGILAESESVIFGYGDELDEHYKSIVNKNDNEYLRNIKSIKYLEAQNYRDLLEFIEDSPYQIFIMGHSCGNSDRTMLNTLFEHKNCISIKPFHHKWDDGTDNYLELIQNISRNFTNMKLMRDRVVNKTLCTEM
jgi:hypothetical protein